MTAQIDAPTTRERAAMEEPVKHTGLSMRLTIGAFIVVPLLAVVAAIPVAWGGWLGWVDLILAAVFYVITAMGVTIGYHRYFTHGSFKAPRWVTIFLATAGSRIGHLFLLKDYWFKFISSIENRLCGGFSKKVF